MKLKITFAWPSGTPPQIVSLLIAGQVLEADGYVIDPRLGTLTISRNNKDESGVATGREDIVVYAPGVWRSIADVGAFAAAEPKEAPRENTRR